MFEKFGEFDSAQELNRAAAAQLAEGDTEAVLAIAAENGIDAEDAQDYIDGAVMELATPLMAALGKLVVEKKALGLSGILGDWAGYVQDACADDQQMAIAVRRKGKSLKVALAGLVRYAFEHKVRVDDRIVDEVRVTRGGREEPMRKPLYLGVPSRTEAKSLLRGYYLGMGGEGGDGDGRIQGA